MRTLRTGLLTVWSENARPWVWSSPQGGGLSALTSDALPKGRHDFTRLARVPASLARQVAPPSPTVQETSGPHHTPSLRAGSRSLPVHLLQASAPALSPDSPGGDELCGHLSWSPTSGNLHEDGGTSFSGLPVFCTSLAWCPQSPPDLWSGWLQPRRWGWPVLQHPTPVRPAPWKF